MHKCEENATLYSGISEKEKLYLQTRLDDQIKWYDENSIKNKKYYTLIKRATIITSALIPFLVSLSIENVFFKVLIGGSGVLITILEGFNSTAKYQENWIEYRSICETLKHEKYMYLYKTGIYDIDEKRFEFFVERIESIISRENVNWASLNNPKKECN